jgi:TetR/AcrR family transcriptional regulator, cholesterol catabolism regulator
MKDRIRVKAQELFMRYGIKSVTMDEIAGHMGISKKTIYQFFTDKDTLVEEVFTERMDHNKLECIEQRTRSDNAIHECFLALHTVEEMLQNMHPSLINDLEKYHPATFKRLQGFKNDFLYKQTTENLRRGVEEGLYKEDLNIDLISRFRIASIFLTLSGDAFPRHKYSILEIESQLMLHFMYGIANNKGLKLVEKYKTEFHPTKTTVHP